MIPIAVRQYSIVPRECTIRTGHHIPKEPLCVVSRDPRQEREQAVEVIEDLVPGRAKLPQPLSARGFGFDIGIGVEGAAGESRLSASDGVCVGSQRVPIRDFDPQALGQPMANFGREIVGHVFFSWCFFFLFNDSISRGKKREVARGHVQLDRDGLVNGIAGRLGNADGSRNTPSQFRRVGLMRTQEIFKPNPLRPDRWG